MQSMNPTVFIICFDPIQHACTYQLIAGALLKTKIVHTLYIVHGHRDTDTDIQGTFMAYAYIYIYIYIYI